MPPRHKALLEGTIDAGLPSIPWNYVAEEAGMNNLGDILLLTAKDLVLPQHQLRR